MTFLLPIVFALGVIFGFVIVERVDQKRLREKFDDGYDIAVDCMTKDGYYIDRFNKTHKGMWVEDLN